MDKPNLNVVILEPKEPIEDKTATASCPKHSFAQVEIYSYCTQCPFFKGIERMVDAKSGRQVPDGVEWHVAFAVSCAFPLQRRIHKIIKSIKG